MEEQQINYPVSTNYRKEWGDWEAIREIVQNALDSEAEVKIISEDHTLVVRDYGAGFELKHLLIGESAKDGENTIGKFGEGLKFGLLTLLRDGRQIDIKTNNIRLRPELMEMFGAKCLRINYTFEEESIQGTEVVIKGMKHNYQERFLSMSREENFKVQVLLDRPGTLFIKGIYAAKKDLIAGYNLIMERENSLTGTVEECKIKDNLLYLIEKTDNKEYMKKLLQAVLENPDGLYLEFYCGSWSVWDMKHPELWKEVVKEVLGEKACRFTNHQIATEAKYRGYNPIICKAFFLKGILKTDMESVVDDNSSRKEYRYAINSLSDMQKDHLRLVLWLIKSALYTDLRDVIQIVEFVGEEDTVGASRYKKYIKISFKVLEYREQLLATVLHELVHYGYAGTDDLSSGFQDTLARISAQIIIYLLNGGEPKPPDGFQLKEGAK